MAAKTKRLRQKSLLSIIPFLLTNLTVTTGSTNPNYILPSESPQDCKTAASDSVHEYFDMTNLTCVACTQNSTIQTVTSDGRRCRCQESYKLIQDYGGAVISCEKCPIDMVASSDGWTCVKCSVPPPPNPEPDVVCPWCEAPQLTADRNLDGTALTNGSSQPERQCITCATNTSADEESGRCSRCNLELRFQDTCDCPPERMTGGLCFPDVSSIEPDYPSLYTVHFQSVSDFRSAYFVRNVRSAQGACAPSWSNLTACQQIANLCVMLLYDLTNTPPTGKLCGATSTACNDACSLYLRLGETLPGNRLPTHNTSNPRISTWRNNMAWLFYPPNTPNDPLRKDLTMNTVMRRGSQLNFTVAQYDVSGHFLGYSSAWINDVTLCMATSEEPPLFGVQWKRQCNLDVDSLLNSTDSMALYELNMPYTANTQDRLYAIPILVKNLKDKSGGTPNTGTDAATWQFVRRFYLLDAVTGRIEAGAPVTVVRYLKTARLHVTLRDASQSGEIYVPWLEVEYAEISNTQYGTGQKIPATFEIVYSMDLSKHQRDLSIAVGVLCGCAVVYSAFQAYNYNRRDGRMAIDFNTILYLVVHLSGTLSNAFFFVMFGVSIWWFFIYKFQEVMTLIPTLEGDYYIKAYLGSAFALKTINIIYLILSQSSVDLFFMDWERPKATEDEAKSQRKAGQIKVSIWRTYFVANEWNELSTVRSINMAALLFVVTLLLKGVGLENLAKLEPSARVTPDVQADGLVEFSRTLRFAISSMIYVGTAVVMWVFHQGAWKRLVADRLAAFRDICSLCNVSVFVMTHEQFGYYIHGRSVHGHADLGLKDLYLNLNREQADLCGERGLEPGTDQQTFEIAFPRQLRKGYNKVLLPVQRARARQRMRTNLSDDLETKLEAYDVLNKFLQNFIDHNLPNLDYTITEKNIFERIMDTEVEDNTDLGYFYVDQGHSFDKSMLYGHEMVLQVFLLLFFTIVDFIGTNFVLSAVLTCIIDQVISRVRYALGRRNIAAKTMVDPRFLI